MRILMLTCYPNIRGPLPKILPVLASALRSQGCHVVTEPWGRHREGESLFEKVIGRVRDIARVRRRVLAGNFDMMLLHTTSEMVNYSRDIPVFWLCRGLIRHLALHFHGSSPALALEPGHAAFKGASRMLLRLADGVMVLSSEEQRQWQQFHPEGRFFLTCNPFESIGSYTAAQSQVPWQLPAGVPVLLYVGRLEKQKGIFDLLEALALLGRQRPFHLLVAGQGTEEQAFQQRIRALGLQDRVSLTGYLVGEKLGRAYRSADLFVFPSWSEGFPTVITEAMDAGLPIVTTHIRGAADHLREGIHACFVPPRNPAKLAEALSRVIADPDLRGRMAHANRAKVREFAPEIVGEQYFGLLKQIAARKDQNSFARGQQPAQKAEAIVT